jgi:hypothetical protein
MPSFRTAGARDAAALNAPSSSGAPGLGERCRREALRVNRRCRCGKRAKEVDHIIPVSLGGGGDLWNLRSLCRQCHLEATKRLRSERTSYIA